MNTTRKSDSNKRNDEEQNNPPVPEIALKLMLLNNYNYDNTVQTSKDYDKIKEAIEAKIGGDEVTREHELIWLGMTPKNGNLTYVVRSKSAEVNTLSIVSRGTTPSLLTIVESLKVYKLVDWPGKSSENIKISSGVDLALRKTVGLTSEVFGAESGTSTPVTIMQLLEAELSDNEKTKLYVTGHSLGGAISTGLTLMIAEKFRGSLEMGRLRVLLYNFAGQTIGNDFFKNYFDSFLSNPKIAYESNRIINPYDTVPFAFDNLEGIKRIYPYKGLGLALVTGLIKLVKAALCLKNKNYTHVGGNLFKLNNAATPSPYCKSKAVTGLKTFGCWAYYEHQPFYYVDLLRSSANKKTLLKPVFE